MIVLDTSEKGKQQYDEMVKKASPNSPIATDCLKAFVEATKTRLNNEALNRQPGLSAGIPPTKGNTEDEITAQLRRYAGLPVHR